MEPYGIAAIFKTAPDIYHAAEKTRDAGYQYWDCITPFPVHGLNHAAGLRRPFVPLLSFVGGVTGFTAGMFMAWYMGEFDYPLVVGGKPFFSPIFPFPVAYELTILLCAFGTLTGMFLFNLLPRFNHPVFNHPTIEKCSDDHFMLYIEFRDPKFDDEKIRDFLKELGGEEIQEIHVEESAPDSYDSTASTSQSTSSTY